MHRWLVVFYVRAQSLISSISFEEIIIDYSQDARIAHQKLTQYMLNRMLMCTIVVCFLLIFVVIGIVLVLIYKPIYVWDIDVSY